VTTLVLTQENFDLTVKENAMVVVDFWAAGGTFSPHFESLSHKYPDLTFGKVNIDQQTELAAMFGIDDVPTLMIMRDSIVLYAESVALSSADFERILDRARALDMDRVRKEIETERQAREAIHMRRVCPTARRGPTG
jgi:thioredoxin-like negative regulator of GroEL